MASLPSAARITSRRTLRQLVAARGASPCASSSQAPSSCQHSRQSIRHKSSAAAASSSSSSSSSGGGSSSTPATVRSDAPLAAVPPIARSTPAVYAALLPHQRATLTSLLARLNLPTDDDALLAQLSSALTHPSWTVLRDGLLDNSYKKESLGPALSAQLEAARTASQGGVVPPHNAALAGLGNSLLGMITTEYLHLTYPNLPNRVLKAALSAHVGPQTSSDVAVELGMGAKGVMKWDVSGEDKVRGSDGKWRKRSSKEVLAQAMRAVVGLIFQTRVSWFAGLHGPAIAFPTMLTISFRGHSLHHLRVLRKPVPLCYPTSSPVCHYLPPSAPAQSRPHLARPPHHTL
jgi:large subunit ribosomal protein L44